MTLEYTNPRRHAVVEDWPLSANRRGRAEFTVEAKRGYGERITRQITDPRRGRTFAPKRGTYARAVRIVDGSDGRTYVISLSMYGSIGVLRGTFQYAEETIFEGDARYPTLRALIDAPTVG